MCKTYDAIYELSNYTKSDILICLTGCMRIEGKLYKCCAEFGDEKCYEGIITLKDAVVKCTHDDNTKEFKWFNVPSKHITSFAFKCCENIEN